MFLKKIYLIIFIFFTVFLTVKCHREQPDKVKIRGKIINPRTGDVVISRNFLLLQSDTLKLNAENEMSGTVNAPEEGLYYLFIFPEFQTIYLKPGDSLAIHLNVDEFDESISFSGSLAFENNLLMEIFLINEKENDFFYNNKFRFNLKSFNKKIDSFEAIKNHLIENYIEDYRQTSAHFKRILSLSKKSVVFNLKENYALKNAKAQLPDNYFSYRSVLHKKLPDPNIIFMNMFVNSFLKSWLNKTCPQNENPYWFLSNIIDNEIVDKKFKDNILTKYCIRYINYYHVYEKDSIVNNFYSKIKNKIYKNFCNDMIANNKLMQSGKPFPAGYFLTSEKHKILSDSLFKPDTKTLVVFWDFRFKKNFASNLEKLKEIQVHYPELKIVVININVDQPHQWLLQKPEINGIYFVQATGRNFVKKIRPYSLAKIYLLNGNTIKISKINMYKPDFDNTLKKFYNEK